MREETVITDDQRRCLRMWFRQAIAQLEQAEVSSAIIEEKDEREPGKHRNHSARRRSRRTRMIPHLRELVF